MPLSSKVANPWTSTCCSQGYLCRFSVTIFCALSASIAGDLEIKAIASPKPKLTTQSISGEACDIVPADNPALKLLNAIAWEGSYSSAQGDRWLVETTECGQRTPGGRRFPSTTEANEDCTLPDEMVVQSATSATTSRNLPNAATSVLPYFQATLEEYSVSPEIPLAGMEAWSHLSATSQNTAPISSANATVEISRRTSVERENLSGVPAQSSVKASDRQQQRTDEQRRLLATVETDGDSTPTSIVETLPYPSRGTPTTQPQPLIPVSRSAIDLLLPEPLHAHTSILANQDSSPKQATDVPESQASSPADSADNRDRSTNELGNIQKIRPATRQPDLQLLLRSSVLMSSDIETSATSFGSLGLINSAFLLTTTKLAPETRLVSLAGGTLVRGTTAKYEFLNFSLGVRQRLAPNTYAQLGWLQEQIYQDGRQRLFDNSIQFTVARQDRLAAKLRLNSFYELRLRFDDPEESSRVTNALGVRLGYSVTPSLEGALDYRLVFDEFTTRPRSDVRQQVSALTIYRLTPRVFISGSVSYLVGSVFSVVSSSETLNNLVFGVYFGLNLY